jgi:diadenylate cyclase
LHLFDLGYIPVRFIDILDIGVVSFLFFQMYKFLRGTFATRMFVGLFFILLIGFIAQTLQMSGISWLMENVKTVWVIAFVIVFQPELRRLLLYLGQNPFISRLVSSSSVAYIDETVDACMELSQRNFGALLVFARKAGLRSIIETGIDIESRLSRELLISIFNPRAPLHDGAVIIRNDLIIAAKCLLPLSQNSKLDAALGTRHRAALGLSEQSDALVVVISEETGKISVAEAGVLSRGLNEQALRDRLLQAVAEYRKRK